MTRGKKADGEAKKKEEGESGGKERGGEEIKGAVYAKKIVHLAGRPRDREDRCAG